MKYNPSKIEKKWQKAWEKEKLHETKDLGNRNFMLLAEFPYTSGNLHMGHWFTYSVADIFGRYLRMNGYNLMYPIGFDAFGLPAENAAIKHKTSPNAWTGQNIKKMTKQLKSIGAAFDWSRTVDTSQPDYYIWTQWIFLKLYEKGLAYRDKTLVNWCPKDKTVLANEQVIDGKCDRCGSSVEQKELAQWMFRITSFADALIDDLENLDWPETTKAAQKNWIGRSEGAIVEFKIKDSDQAIEVFTTRVDTIFGATYLVLAPEHPLVQNLASRIKNLDQVGGYIKEAKRKTELQRMSEIKDKTGVRLEGISALNPLTEKEISVWVADYVLSGYGTGAVMAVPAHDDRDYDFAKKFSLPIKKVVLPHALGRIIQNVENIAAGAPTEIRPVAEYYTGEGELADSGEFTGLDSEEARKKITVLLKEKGIGHEEKRYRLHDWILSRQRYWGAPIPVIHCPKCGYQPMLEKDLPVKLPKLDDFMPVEGGKSPLARSAKWLKAKCPSCKGSAERETDTMDTFVDSSWYFMRYTDPENSKEFATKEKMKKWLPVPVYVGGREHNTMHLLYARFIAKALNSLGFVEFSEPFLSRKNHGVIMAPDGKRMSKSKGNTIDPDGEVARYGADAVRMNFAFLGPFDQDYAWNNESISGVSRFLNRIWNFISRSAIKGLTEKSGKEIDLAIHRAVKNVGEDVKNFKFNTAVSGLMKLLNELDGLCGEKENISREYINIVTKLLAPFAPHMAEELWRSVLGNDSSIHLTHWPEYDGSILDQELVTIVIQINGKTRDSIKIKKGVSEEELKEIIMNREKVKQYVKGPIKKFIFVPDKLTNIVT
ncbi:MAG TPA: leucine--tRNA ligase [Candidatus Paceibacterota bacterium]